MLKILKVNDDRYIICYYSSSKFEEINKRELKKAHKVLKEYEKFWQEPKKIWNYTVKPNRNIYSLNTRYYIQISDNDLDDIYIIPRFQTLSKYLEALKDAFLYKSPNNNILNRNIQQKTKNLF